MNQGKNRSTINTLAAPFCARPPIPDHDMTNYKLWLSCVLLPVMMAEAALGQEDHWNGTISQDDGVTFVHNTETPLYARDKIHLVQAFSLGGQEAFFEDLPLHQVRGVAVDQEGNMYVSDGGNARVVVFDAEGRLVRTFGQKGSGPGEFDILSKVKIGEDDRVYTLDAKLRRVSIFSRDGRFLQSFKFKEHALGMEAKDADHVFLITWDFRPQASLVAVDKTTGERTGDLVAPQPTSQQVLMTGNGGNIVRIADGVYYAFSYPYRIERFDNSGALQRVITRKHEAFVAPEDSKAVGGSIIGADLPNRISGIGVASNGIVVVQTQMEDKPNGIPLDRWRPGARRPSRGG